MVSAEGGEGERGTKEWVARELPSLPQKKALAKTSLQRRDGRFIKRHRGLGGKRKQKMVKLLLKGRPVPGQEPL